MTDINTTIAEVKRLDAEATRKPWNAGLGCVYENDGFSAGDPNAPDTRIAQANDKDSELIAYYRTAAPALAAEVERLRAEVVRLTRDSDRLVTIIDEAFGLQCVQTPDEILSCLETNLTKMRLDATAAERERDEARAQAKMFGGVMEKVEADRDSLRAKLEWMTANRDGFEAASKRHEADATTLRAKLAEAERQLDEWHRSRGFAYSSQPSPVVPNNPAYVAASPKSLTPCDDCPERQKDGSCPLSPEQCAKQAPFAGVNRADLKTLAEAMATLPEGYGGPAQAIAGAEAYLAESRLTRYAALERAVREMHPGNWSPNVVHALDALTHAPAAPDDERGCPTCATLAGKIERLRAEVERLTRDRERLAGYVCAARQLSRDAHKHLLEERPEETARAIYRVICALASAAKEGAEQ